MWLVQEFAWKPSTLTVSVRCGEVLEELEYQTLAMLVMQITAIYSQPCKLLPDRVKTQRVGWPEASSTGRCGQTKEALHEDVAFAQKAFAMADSEPVPDWQSRAGHQGHSAPAASNGRRTPSDAGVEGPEVDSRLSSR